MSNEFGIKCAPLLRIRHINKEKTTGRRQARKTKKNLTVQGEGYWYL
jgi:hypothetical protein